jgi:hypothetical protein
MLHTDAVPHSDDMDDFAVVTDVKHIAVDPVDTSAVLME